MTENRKPLISVIVPVYNGQDCLAACIDSIEGQTYGNLEVIIINDGSTDRTIEVCDRLQAVYDNVRVLTMNDEGVSAARNAGIGMVKGEFITFVDADDRLRSDMLRTLYECMMKAGSDIAGCRFFMWRNEAEWEQAKRDMPGADETAGRVRSYDAGTYLREELLCGNSRCWSKLYRKEIVSRVRFPENLTIGEDMLFLVRLLPFVDKITETDYQGYGYYQNPTGAIQREFTPRYMDQITCWELVREEVSVMEPALDSRAASLGMMGIMLTAGKLAMLPSKTRRENEEYIRVCHKKLKEAMKIPGAYGKLSIGYRLKTALFRVCPMLYLHLYHFHKK